MYHSKPCCQRIQPVSRSKLGGGGRNARTHIDASVYVPNTTRQRLSRPVNIQVVSAPSLPLQPFIE